MFDSEQTQTIRETLRSVLAQCNVSGEPTPFDYSLYQECVDEAIRRGYPVDGDHSVRKFLSVGVVYAATAGGHLDRTSQIWLALFTGCATYIDEIPVRFPSEIPNVYLFNDRYMAIQQQPNAVLNAFADIVRRASDIFLAIPSKLIIASVIRFIASNVFEYETVSMQIASAARRYPIYYREMTGLAEGYSYMGFSHQIPWTEYIQAIPEIMLFVTDMNDVLSFYKEELAGEDNNQISVMARQNNGSHSGAFKTLADITVGHYKRAMEILEGNPKAYEECKRFCAGYIAFHLSSERYKLAELGL